MDDSVPDTSQIDILINLESMIKSHLSQIQNLEVDLDKQKALLEDIFKNDQTYQAHDTQAKEAIKVRTATKQQVLKQPQAADLNQKVKSSRSQVKELKEALSDYLREYQRISGLSEIEDEEGEVRTIVYTAKLVKK